MMGFYYVSPNELDKLKGCSLEMSYIRTVCDHAVLCSEGERYIIAVDSDMLKADEIVHIERHERVLSMISGYNKIPGLDSFINQFRHYDPVIWIGKIIRNENLCNNKDIEWYKSQSNL